MNRRSFRRRHRDHWTPEPPSATLELSLGGGRWAEVGIAYREGDPGRRSGHPDNWTPPEPGWLEVQDCTLTDDERPGEDVVLMGERLERWAAEHDEAIRALAADELGLIL